MFGVQAIGGAVAALARPKQSAERDSADIQPALYPDGPDTPPAKHCDGTADVSNQDTPQTQPAACWWQYTHSSADQPGRAYPVRLQADWSVHYRDASGTHTLASFAKYDDVPVPVYDIQTLIIN